MGRPRDPQRIEARRAEVAEAALRTISAYGIEGASLRAIAREGGFTTGTLAYYFRNKQEILLFAGRTILRALVARLATALSDHSPLRSLETALLRELPAEPDTRLGWQIWLAFTAKVPSDAEYRREHEERYAEIRTLVRHSLNAAAKSGELVKGTDRAAAVDQILSLFDGLGLHALLEPEHFPPTHQRRLLRGAIRALERPRITQQGE
jgi:AcrR family transcriptional regulator